MLSDKLAATARNTQELDRLKAAHAEGVLEAGKQNADKFALELSAKVKNAAAGERARIKGILENPDAGGREQFAQQLAFGSTLSVAEAGELLKTQPKVAKESALEKHMRLLGTPGITGYDGPQPAQANSSWDHTIAKLKAGQ